MGTDLSPLSVFMTYIFKKLFDIVYIFWFIGKYVGIVLVGGGRKSILMASDIKG